MSLTSPHAVDARAIECGACGRAQMVDGRVPGAVEFACAHCGEEQQRGLGAPLVDGYRASAGRGRARAKSGRLVSFDLREPPEGLAPLAKAKVPVEALRARFDAARATLAKAHLEQRDLEAEWHMVWLATMLAARYHVTRDLVRERALLETTLENAALPAYRALVLGRLARLAAKGGGFELADAWLALATERTGIAEADGDIEASAAYLSLVRGEPEDALARLGQEEGSAIAGVARPFADVVRVDALEATGQLATAYGLYRTALRAHGNRAIAALAAKYALAKKSRAKVMRVGIGAAAILLGLVTIVGIGFQHGNWKLLAAFDGVFLPLVIFLVWFRMRRRRRGY